MHKRTVFAGYASIFLLLATLGAPFVMRVAASPDIIRVPTDYPTIQAAIYGANSGDIIEVASNTYYENVVINKSLTLRGESSSTTIIDGGGTGTVVRINVPDVNITGFTVQNGGDPPYSGIFLGSCVGNTIYDCIVAYNAYGMELYGSNSNIIFGNKIMNNSNAGILIRGSNNVFHDNLIANNSIGVWIPSGSSLLNTFYHNNFIDNMNHVSSFAGTTKWDNGAEGNYWSDYNGADLDGDGIGETLLPYLGVDQCPLMEPWSPYRVFSVIIDAITYNVTTFSNSTLASFNFSQPLKQISFNATSGASGFCNATIPKALLNVSTPEVWKVVIDDRLLSTGERTVTENGTHTSIYFTYTAGTHEVQITTRMGSTIMMTLSSSSINLGSNVTINGNITAEDHTMRPNVTVTILYRVGGGNWITLGTVETDENGSYTCPWEPGTAGIYEVMASWEGDETCIGDQSDVLTLTVIENSTIFIALSSTSIAVGDIVIISGNVTAADLTVRPNVNVTISYKLGDAETWTWLANVTTYLNGSYSYIWTPEAAGTYEVRATWLGDEITYGNTSDVLTLTAKWGSNISIDLSSTKITHGKSVTISGNVTAADNTARANVIVMIRYRLGDAETWTWLANVTTKSDGIYSYPWTPETTGIYEIMASWEGDDITVGNESNMLTLTVKEAPSIPLEIVTIAVVVIVAIAAIVVYFIKFRKSK